MYRKQLSYCIVILCFMVIINLFSSCSNLEVYTHVLYGNYLFANGRNQDALLQYYKAQSVKVHEDWILYNIARVYQELGEYALAQSIWEDLKKNSVSELQFRVYFSLGELYYARHFYQKAFESYRQALRIEPNNVLAKKNIELTLQQLNTIKAPRALPNYENDTENENKNKQSSTQLSAEQQRLLDFVMKKEAFIWNTKQNFVKIESILEDW